MVAVGIVALGATLIVLWQWRITMKELKAFEHGQESNFDVLLKNIQENRSNKLLENTDD